MVFVRKITDDGLETLPSRVQAISKPGWTKPGRAALRQCECGAQVRHPALISREMADARAVFHYLDDRIRSISFSSNAGVHSSAA